MPSKIAHTPEEFALAFSRGEEHAFDWFFRQLYPALTFFSNRIIRNQEAAEEIASSAFIKLWAKQAQFTSHQFLKSYLYTIVKNDSLKWLAREGKAKAAMTEVSYLHPAQEDDYTHAIITSEVTRQLLSTINMLPSECKKVFKLIYLEGKSVKETAEELQVSLSTIKTQKARGLKIIKTKLALTLSLALIMYGL